MSVKTATINVHCDYLKDVIAVKEKIIDYMSVNNSDRIFSIAENLGFSLSLTMFYGNKKSVFDLGNDLKNVSSSMDLEYKF